MHVTQRIFYTRHFCNVVDGWWKRLFLTSTATETQIITNIHPKLANWRSLRPAEYIAFCLQAANSAIFYKAVSITDPSLLILVFTALSCIVTVSLNAIFE